MLLCIKLNYIQHRNDKRADASLCFRIALTVLCHTVILLPQHGFKSNTPDAIVHHRWLIDIMMLSLYGWAGIVISPRNPSYDNTVFGKKTMCFLSELKLALDLSHNVFCQCKFCAHILCICCLKITVEDTDNQKNVSITSSVNILLHSVIKLRLCCGFENATSSGKLTLSL